jgi:hypothetical protein
MRGLHVLTLLILLAACSAEPPVTDVPFYTATPGGFPTAASQFAGADVPLEFMGGDPQILDSGGRFSFAVSGSVISQQDTGTIVYSAVPQFGAIPVHDQLYITASDADSSEQISFAFSPNLPVGTYPLIAPSDFIMGTVAAQYQRLGASEETYDEEISGSLTLAVVGETLSGEFQFSASYIQRSAEGEVQTQRVDITGSFADVPYRELGADPFEVIVPLPTRVFTGTDVPVDTEIPETTEQP